MRPALRYFGGKYRLASWIISHFPAHKVYVEPYGGAASVLLKKERSYAEVYNDLDDSVFNLFSILRDFGDASELMRQVCATPYSRREFEIAHIYHPDRIESARRLIVRSFMGFGADSVTNLNSKTSFRSNSNRSGTTPAHDWVNYPKSIPEFHERLKGVILENKDALVVMAQHDSPETLHYIDPPYIQSLRRKNSYNHEMNDQQHVELIEFIKTLKGPVILSGYENELYNSLGWKKVTKEARADGASKRTEVLWIKGN